MGKKSEREKSRKIWAYLFIFGLGIAIIIFDMLLTSADPVGKSTLFVKNDFEKIKLTHPEEVYEKVFYGNSVVISAFIEEESKSGYVNMGMDYGTVEDLSKILERNMVSIGTDLVVGANYLTFLDTLDTNPTYPWHRKVYEPYLYFQRDRLHPFIINGIGNILKGENFVTGRHTNLDRYVYYGVLPDEEIDKKIEGYKELYWNRGIECYEKNYKALQNVIDYCKERDIELRFVWFPWNSYIAKPESVIAVEEKAKKIMGHNNIEYIDLADAFGKECFHDLGHLNYELGAVEFTKEIDKWLNRE
ncbi:MAG: hypothetical protein GX925_01920 [Clostridiales bacterium]|nr:hypothetical protein [Clostridiales bacterium]